MQTVHGRYLTISQYNVFFSDVTAFLLEHHDTPENADAVVILGSYLFTPVARLRLMYPHKRIILFQLESLTSGNWHNWNTPTATKIQADLAGADEIWEYDPHNSTALKAAGIENMLKPFAYTKSIDVGLDAGLDDGECDIDVLFYGFVNHRRVNILHPMQSKLYGRRSFVFAFGVHGAALDHYIRRSKIILTMHAFDEQAQEQVRMLRPICNGKLVLSEHSKFNFYGDAIREFASIDSLVEQIEHYVTADRYKIAGAEAREKFKARLSAPA
jgi:hypothetical protein